MSRLPTSSLSGALRVPIRLALRTLITALYRSPGSHMTVEAPDRSKITGLILLDLGPSRVLTGYRRAGLRACLTWIMGGFHP